MSAKAVAVDMDQEVTLTVTVALSLNSYSPREKEKLTQKVTAPLWLLKTIDVRNIARLLNERMFNLFINGLRDREMKNQRAAIEDEEESAS